MDNLKVMGSSGPPREFRSPGAKKKDETPLRAKRAENFRGLEIIYGKILLIYFMRSSGL